MDDSANNHSAKMPGGDKELLFGDAPCQESGRRGRVTSKGVNNFRADPRKTIIFSLTGKTRWELKNSKDIKRSTGEREKIGLTRTQGNDSIKTETSPRFPTTVKRRKRSKVRKIRIMITNNHAHKNERQKELGSKKLLMCQSNFPPGLVFPQREGLEGGN